MKTSVKRKSTIVKRKKTCVPKSAVRKNLIRVWTLATHNSFMTFGKPEYYPMATWIEGQGPYDLGKGFKGYLIVAPNGRTFVAEATTGAFIQDTIEKAKDDIRACSDKKFMQKQVDDAAKLLKDASKPGAANALEVVDPKEFWTKLKCMVSK